MTLRNGTFSKSGFQLFQDFRLRTSIKYSMFNFHLEKLHIVFDKFNFLQNPFLGLL